MLLNLSNPDKGWKPSFRPAALASPSSSARRFPRIASPICGHCPR